jgi:plastocyanin
MDAKLLRSALLGAFIILALVGAGCAGQREPKKMTAAAGKKTLAMTASNFKFEPSVIQALMGDTLVFKISNASSLAHNFTIKDPLGQIIESVELPPNKSVSVEIPLRDTGAYEFYCDKPFHATMGMKGHVEVLLPR